MKERIRRKRIGESLRKKENGFERDNSERKMARKEKRGRRRKKDNRIVIERKIITE